MAAYLRHPSFAAKNFEKDGKRHLLLAASGSVATIKIPVILDALSSCNNLSVRLILTHSAKEFLAGQSPEQPPWETLIGIRNVDSIHSDEDEWDPAWVRNAPILHIELRRWADLLLIAPLSADTMAKIAMGFSDNLLLSVIRAWDTTGEIDGGAPKPIVVAPAMNTAMYHHPITKRHLDILEHEWTWFIVLKPMEKRLACGDTGSGAMKEWSEIVIFVKERLEL